MIDGQQFLTEFLEAGKATIAQDTMKDGFATLVDSEGKPFVANLNPKEKERYKETGKPLSKVKKEKGEEGKKEPEAKKTEEKKKPESEKKGSAEVIELHPEKAKEDQKHIVNWGGRDWELTKKEIDNEIASADDKIKFYQDQVDYYTKSLKRSQKKAERMENNLKFWSDYKNRKDTDLTPQQFYDKNKSDYKITHKDDLDEIAWDFNKQRADARVAVCQRNLKDAQYDIDLDNKEMSNFKKDIEKQNEYKKALTKGLNMAQDSLDTFLKNISVEQR